MPIYLTIKCKCIIIEIGGMIMDPVTVVVIGVVTLAAAPFLGKLALYGAMQGIKKIKKTIKKKREYHQRHDKKYQARLKKTRDLQRSIEKRRTTSFRNTKTGEVKNVNINEINTFDMSKDIILKGTVYIQNPNGGEPAKDTIYLFQPRVYGVNNVPIGPKTDKNGHLYDKNSYLLRTPGSNDIYSGYVPKREVLSGRQFDFVGDSANLQDNPLNGFINIEIEKDANGNFIPLDKNNAEAMREFNNYVRMRQQHNVDQDRYLDGLVAKAIEAKEVYDEINKPRYARPTEQMSDSDMHKIEKARASRAKRDAQNRAYYDRIAHMNMLDSAMHDYGLDDHAAHLPGAGMIGPRPMGPGPRGPQQGGGGPRR